MQITNKEKMIATSEKYIYASPSNIGLIKFTNN